MPNGFISPDDTGLQNYTLVSSNSGFGDLNQLILNPLQGTGTQYAFVADDSTGLFNYTAVSSNSGFEDLNQLILNPLFGTSGQRGFIVSAGTRQPNLRRVVRWT